MLTPLPTAHHENSKITTNCWTTIERRMLEPAKKTAHLQRQKRSCNETQEGHYHDKIKPHTCQVGDPQSGEQLYHKGSPTVVQVLSPTWGFPAWGCGKGTRNPQGIWLWRLAGFDCWNSAGLGETKTPLLEGTHTTWCTWGPGESSSNPKETEPDLPTNAGGSLAEAWVHSGSPRGQGPWQQVS